MNGFSVLVQLLLLVGLRAGIRVRRMHMLRQTFWFLINDNDAAANPLVWVVRIGNSSSRDVERSANNWVVASKVLVQSIHGEAVGFRVSLLEVNFPHLWVLEGIWLTVLVNALHWIELVIIFRIIASVTKNASLINLDIVGLGKSSAGESALNLDGVTWNLRKLNEAIQEISASTIVVNHFTDCVDRLFDSRRVGNDRRAVLLVKTPPARCVLQSSRSTPRIGMTGLSRFFLVLIIVPIRGLALVAVTRGDVLRWVILGCIGVIDSTLAIATMRICSSRGCSSNQSKAQT